MSAGLTKPRSFALLFEEQFLSQISAAHTLQSLLDRLAAFGLIPEEELALRQLLLFGVSRIDLLQGVRMIPRIVDLRGERHGGRREVLHLFQLEMQLLGDSGQFGHVDLSAAGMAGDEVGNQLLV